MIVSVTSWFGCPAISGRTRAIPLSFGENGLRAALLATARAIQAPEFRGSSSNSAPKERRISAAGRKAMADAAKRRWAAIRARKADGTKAEGSAPAPEDEQFKKRMLETMKASRAKQKKSVVKKKAA